MPKKKNVFVANLPIFSGLGGGITLLGTYLFSEQILIAVIAGIAVFAGMFLIGGAMKDKKKEYERSVEYKTESKLDQGKLIVSRIRSLATRVTNKAIRAKIVSIYSTAEQLFQKLDEGGVDQFSELGTLVMSLEQLAGIIDHYVGSLVGTRRVESVAAGEETFLRALTSMEKNLNDNYQLILQEDSTKLAALSESLEELMKIQNGME